MSLPFECWSTKRVAAIVNGFGRLLRVDDESINMMDISKYRCEIAVDDLREIPQVISITLGDDVIPVVVQVERWVRVRHVYHTPRSHPPPAGLMQGGRSTRKSPNPQKDRQEHDVDTITTDNRGRVSARDGACNQSEHPNMRLGAPAMAVPASKSAAVGDTCADQSNLPTAPCSDSVEKSPFFTVEETVSWRDQPSGMEMIIKNGKPWVGIDSGGKLLMEEAIPRDESCGLFNPGPSVDTAGINASFESINVASIGVVNDALASHHSRQLTNGILNCQGPLVRGPHDSWKNPVNKMGLIIELAISELNPQFLQLFPHLISGLPLDGLGCIWDLFFSAWVDRPSPTGHLLSGPPLGPNAIQDFAPPGLANLDRASRGQANMDFAYTGQATCDAPMYAVETNTTLPLLVMVPISHSSDTRGPPRASVRLQYSTKDSALERAKRRKAQLLEGGSSSAGTVARKWSCKKLLSKSSLCGVKLSEADAEELHKFLLCE